MKIDTSVCKIRHEMRLPCVNCFYGKWCNRKIEENSRKHGEIRIKAVIHTTKELEEQKKKVIWYRSHNKFIKWADCELELLKNFSLSISEVSKATGRTPSAVSGRRVAYRKGFTGKERKIV